MSEAESAPAPALSSLPEVVNTAPAPSMIPPPPPIEPPFKNTEELVSEPCRTVVEVRLEPPRRNVVEYAVVGIIALFLGVVCTSIMVNYITSVVKLGSTKSKNVSLVEQNETLQERLDSIRGNFQITKDDYEVSLEELKKARKDTHSLVQEVEKIKADYIKLGTKYSELQEVLVKVKTGEIKVKVDKDFDPTSTKEIIRETSGDDNSKEKSKEEGAEVKKKSVLKPWTWFKKK